MLYKFNFLWKNAVQPQFHILQIFCEPGLIIPPDESQTQVVELLRNVDDDRGSAIEAGKSR